MSKSIDERIVSMQFDNSKFESNVSQTMSTLDKLKQALKFDKAGEGLDNVGKAVDNVKMDGLGAACETVSAKFSALQVAAITALSNITNDAVNAGKKIVSALTLDGAKDGFTEYELKMGSVQTIMNSTGENLGTVMSYLEELNTYADKTIYSFSDMTTNIGKFTNAGVKLEDAVAAIKGVSNEAAVSGANAEEASRAMYNFAQALSAGYVKLIDWKSIENANMATVEFKNQLIETALALGTVVKEGELYRSTTTNAKGQTSELFDATHAFNEALNAQWMTTDVLTKTLAKYADESTDLGKKAYAAAQDVKTFSMMVDTLKEAIGSGWAVTWEKFIGDFEQSKKIFTKITNELSDVISAQADARNKFVNDAFNKSGVSDKQQWASLSMSIISAGADMAQFKKVVMETAEANGISVKELIEQYGSFEKSLESGWLTAEVLDQSITKIQKLGDVSPAFSKLAAAVNASNKPFQVLREELTAVSGRTHIVNSLTNIFEALSAVVKPVKEAFRDIFPAKTGKELRDALGNFEKFTKTLIISDDAAKRIKDTFTGFFKILKSGIDTIKSIIDAFSPLKDIFIILVENLLQGAEGLGEFFNTLSDGDDEVSLFKTILKSIHDTLQAFADNLQNYIDKAKNAIITLKEMLSQSWDTGALSIVATIVEKIKASLSGFTEGASKGLKEFFDTIGQGFDGSGFQKVISVLEKFCEGIKKIAGVLGEQLKPVFEKLKEFFSGMDILDTLAVTIEAGGVSAVVAFLGRMADNILDFSDQVKGLIEAVSNGDPVKIIEDFITGITDALGSVEDKLRSDVIANFALSVGILAGSIFVLSTIDADAAERTVGIISLLIAELVGIFVALKKINFNKINSDEGLVGSIQTFINNIAQTAALSQTAMAIAKLAVAVLILAAAMKMIAGIPLGPMAASFAVISALLWELVKVTQELSKHEGKLIKGAGSLVVLASSVMVLSVAMKILASIGWPELITAGIALTAIITELVTVCKLLDGNKGVTGAGAMIALAAAVLILAGAMKIMGSMSFEEISAGLFAIAGVLIELGVALALMPAALPGAAALLVASAALVVLAGALKLMSTIAPEKILPVLGLLGGVLAELAVGLTTMILALPGAIALVTVAKGLAILTPVLIALGAVPAKNIYKALGEIAVALIAFGAIGTVLSIVSPLILAFSAALLVFGVAVAAIGGGLALAGAGLTALATSFGLLSEIGKEAAERVVVALQIILNGVIQLMPNMVKAFGEGLIQICEVFVKGAPTIKSAISALFDILIEVFGESIPKLAESFTKLLSSLIDQAVIMTPKIVDAIFQMITSILDTFAQRLPEIIQAGVDIMVAFIEGIQSATNQLIDASMKAIIAFINGLADSIEQHTPELIEAVNHLFKAVVTAMLLILSNGNPEFVKKTLQIMNSIKNSITSKVSDVVSAITSMISKMLSAIKDKVNDFKNAAKNLVEGFINGIKDKIESAKEAVKNLGNSAINTLTSTLKEHSPSKITTQIGSYFGEGFVNGIVGENSYAKQASDKLANTAINGLKDAIGSISNLVDGSMDLNPTITPVLDLSNVEAGANKINSLSSNWNGMSLDLATNSSVGFNKNVLIKSSIADENQNGINLLKSTFESLKMGDSNRKLDTIVDMMTQFMPLIGQGQVVLDSGATVGALAPKMDAELGRRATMRGRNV